MQENNEELVLRGDFITLTQLMKTLNWVGGGSEAHIYIMQGEVSVNGEPTILKRKKLYAGDVVVWQELKATVVSDK